METEMQTGISYASLIPLIFGTGIPYLYQMSKELREQKSKALHDYFNSIAAMIFCYSKISPEDLSNAKKTIADRYKVPRSIFPLKKDALQAIYLQILSSDNITIDSKKEFRRRKTLIAADFIANDRSIPDLTLSIKDFAKNEIPHEFIFFFALFNFFFSIYLLCKEAEHINLTFYSLCITEITFSVYSALTAVLITFILMVKNYSWREWKEAMNNIVIHRERKKENEPYRE